MIAAKSNWGGKRKGAGRPRLDPNGCERKNRPLYCTVEEWNELKNYLAKIRERENYKVDNLVKYNNDWQNGYRKLQDEYEKLKEENKLLKNSIYYLNVELKEEKNKSFFDRIWG